MTTLLLDEPAELQTASLSDGNMEYKNVAWEVKALDDSGKLTIYAAYFSNRDRGDDIIEPGAFKSGLNEYLRSGWLGVNHDMQKLPVGFPLSAVEDFKGLLCEFQFHSTPEAQACRTVVLERMKAGKSVFGSIGYKVASGGSKQEYVNGQSIRRLTDVTLFETSVVLLPMNPKAEAVSAKSLLPANPQADLVSVKSADEPPTPEGDPMPDLYSLDEVKTLLDEVRTKAGRVISKANHEKLTTYADQLDEHGDSAKCMAQDMKSWLGQVKPPGAEEPDEDDKPDKPADKDIIPQDRAAGNSIPADQNPHGAVTADDLAKRKAAKAVSLDALRQRVLKDLTRFHSLSS